MTQKLTALILMAISGSMAIAEVAPTTPALNLPYGTTVSITNPEEYPWYYNAETDTYTSSNQGLSGTDSRITFNTKSYLEITVQFTYEAMQSTFNALCFYVDDEEVFRDKGASDAPVDYSLTLPAGEHQLSFSYQMARNSSAEHEATIKNFKVLAECYHEFPESSDCPATCTEPSHSYCLHCHELMADGKAAPLGHWYNTSGGIKCLKEGCDHEEPLAACFTICDEARISITNDEKNPWAINDEGKLVSTNQHAVDGTSEFLLNIEATKECVLEFNYISAEDNTRSFKAYLDDEKIVKTMMEECIITAGTHTLKFQFDPAKGDGADHNYVEISDFTVKERCYHEYSGTSDFPATCEEPSRSYCLLCHELHADGKAAPRGHWYNTNGGIKCLNEGCDHEEPLVACLKVFDQARISFINDEEFPWYSNEEGKLTCTNPNGSSKITIKIKTAARARVYYDYYYYTPNKDDFMDTENIYGRFTNEKSKNHNAVYYYLSEGNENFLILELGNGGGVDRTPPAYATLNSFLITESLDINYDLSIDIADVVYYIKNDYKSTAENMIKRILGKR